MTTPSVDDVDFELPPLEFLDVDFLNDSTLTDTKSLAISPWIRDRVHRVISLHADYKTCIVEGCYIAAMDVLKTLDRLLFSLLKDPPPATSSAKDVLTSSSPGISPFKDLFCPAQLDRRKIARLTPAQILGHTIAGHPLLSEPLVEIAAETKYLMGLHYFGGLDVLPNPLKAWGHWKEAWELSGRHYLQKSGRCYTHSGPVAEAAGYAILKTYFNSAEVFPTLDWKAPGDWSLKPEAIRTPTLTSSAREVPHQFRSTTFPLPTWCSECGDFIWGAWKQGKECTLCAKPVHHRCARTAPPNCGGVKRSWIDHQGKPSMSSSSQPALPTSTNALVPPFLSSSASSFSGTASSSFIGLRDHDETILVNNPLFAGNFLVTIPASSRFNAHPSPALVEFYRTEFTYARQMAILHEYYLEELIHLLSKAHPWPLSKTIYSKIEGKLHRDHLIPYRDHIHRIWRQSEAFCHRLVSFLETTVTHFADEHLAELIELFGTHLIKQHDLRDLAAEYCPLDEMLAGFPEFPPIYKTLRGLILLPLVRAPRYELLVDNCLKSLAVLLPSAWEAAADQISELKESLKSANQRYCSQIGRIRSEFLLLQIPNLLELLPNESKATVYAFFQPAEVTSTLPHHHGKCFLLASNKALYALSSDVSTPKQLLWQLSDPISDVVITTFNSTLRIFCHAQDPASPLWHVHEIHFTTLQPSQLIEIVNHLNHIFHHP